MDDPQALRTLQRIEKLLEQSVAAAKLDITDDRTQKVREAVKNRGKKSTGKDETFEFTRQVVRATTRLSVFSDEADKLQKSAQSARKEIFNLASDVRSTRSNIFAFSTAAKGVADSVATLKFDEHNKTVAEQDGLMGSLSQSTLLSASSLDTLTGTSKRLNAAFEKVVGTVLRTTAVTSETTRTGTELSGEAAEATVVNTDATKKNTEATTKSTGFVSGMLRRFGVNIKEAGDTSEWFKGQLSNLGFAVSEALINLTRDVFYLQSRGISAGDSLFELYGNAMKAGMSLQEYTSLLQDNSAAVVRFGSFSDFGDSIDRTTRQLNRLGVFGPAAEQLAASMKTNAVSLGIPMQQQEGAINSQVKVFEQLRKSTLMTADGFRELVADISNNQNVQEELLGLAPAERAARQAQIIQGTTIGQRLGATAEASKSLTDALLAQRKSTVKDRFKAQGVIRQAGAITGMGAAQTNELAKLAMKNPATLSVEERERMVSLFGEFEQRLQGMKNSGNIAAENIADELIALRGSVSAGQVSEASGRVTQQVEAGKAINPETGQPTNGVQQEIGQALTVLSGFMKNPLADAMVIFTGMMAQAVLQNSLLAVIANNTGGFGDSIMGKIFGKKETTGQSPKGGAKGKLSSVIGSMLGINSIPLDLSPADVMGGVGPRPASVDKGIKGAVIKMLGIDSLNNIPLSLTEADFGTGNAGTTIQKTLKQKLLGGIKATMGIGGKIGLFAMVFSGIEELFTGEMTAALDLGGGIGGRLLGAVTAGISGFFTGFTRFIDDGLNWVSDGLGLGWNVNMTRFVDQATLYLTTGFKLLGVEISNWGIGLKGWISDALASSLEFFGVGSSAPWVKSLRASADQATKDIEANEQRKADIMKHYHGTSEKLWEGERTTLRTIGADQVKAQKETADKVKGLTKTTQDNVVYGAENLMDSARRKAATLTSTAQVATPAQPSTTTVATPQPTRQPQVTPPEVNRTQVEQDRKRDASQSGGALTVIGMAELVVSAQQQLDVLKQMLAHSMQKTDDPVLQKINRPQFSDNALMYNISQHPAA